MLDLLKNLCEIDGTSGREEDVRNFIISQIDGKCEYHTDNMGNLICFKKGRNRSKNKVMLTAHMDEVGFIVTGITSGGYINFETVGGIDSKVIAGRTVCFSQSKEKINGVIGLKPVHLADSNDTVPDYTSLVIDIGARSKEEAEKYVEVGDSAYFVSNYTPFGTDKICSKAIDDRFGCAVMIKMIEEQPEFDMYFCFLVQEEVGLRGAPAAAYGVNPDYAIVLESTTAADVAGVEGNDRVCMLGNGAVVSFMDRSTVYDIKLFKEAFSLAESNGISIQTKTLVAGGNDAGAIHKSNCGIKTITISLPTRYIHSATSVADTKDMKSCYDLAVLLSKEYCNA